MQEVNQDQVEQQGLSDGPALPASGAALANLGRYQIIKELGRGAMGTVYKARDPLIDRNVAIKAINLQILTPEERDEYEARFYQEARAIGRLNHRNIGSIYDLGESGGMVYIAMELLEGKELHHLLSGGQCPPLEETLGLIIQVATGLAYAHERGIVHRDIKPSNIMVLNGNQAKIVDFGISSMPASLMKTQQGKVLGSPLYMSPEQVMGLPMDYRLDIFSLGVMLYQMLTGRLPFYGESNHAVMFQIVHENPPRPSSLNPKVPDSLDAIVFKCMAKNPDERYQSAHVLTDDLRACHKMLMHAKSGVERRQSRASAPGDYRMRKLKPMGVFLLLLASLEIGRRLF